MLATKGSQDQLIACGLKLVGHQLNLTKLVKQLQAQDSVESSPLSGMEKQQAIW